MISKLKMALIIAVIAYVNLADASVVIKAVEAQQRYPWNGKVDISFTVENAGAEVRDLSVWAVDQTTGITNFATAVTGDTAYTSGQHKIVWDMAADGLTLVSDDVVFAVSYKEPPLYCVIDLSGGTSAASYPVTYLDDVPSGGWSDEYKTTKLVLRKISAGTFTMGSPTDELGRSTYYDETQHQVTLTKDYYVGVFPVTQRQWELVMGTRPSCFNNNACYASRPVEQVSYNMIRGSSAGAGWPNSSDVDATSFLGVLRAKSGLKLDLPTEAQWEYACRAGTTTALNSGKNLTGTSRDAEMDKVGRYWYNGGSGYSQSCDLSAATAKVGSYAPNAWGLYDMHGNVWELCLDWYGSYSGDATDPKGSSSGSLRVMRGGSWNYVAYYCRSANRYYIAPSDVYRGYGFRLVRTLSEDAIAETAARSEAVAATSGGASCQSDLVRINLIVGKRTASPGGEVLCYDASWFESGSEVKISDNETVVMVGTAGSYLWHPVSYCLTRHTLKLEALSGGQVVGEETAEFESEATLGHEEVVTTAAKEPTCTEVGCTKGAYCSRCNEVLATSESIPALGHVAVETKPAVAVGCTTDGCTHEVTCSRCHAVLEASQVLPKLGHVEVVTTAAKNPTCTEDGCTKGSYCSRCKAVLATSKVLQNYGGHSGAITKPAVEPTSAKAGSTAEIRCSRCNALLQAAETIPALGYVRNVTARQLWPHKKVEVSYTLADDIGEVAEEKDEVFLTSSAGYAARNVIGDKHCTPGPHRVVWDMEADGVKVKADEMKFTVMVGGGAPGFVTKTFSSSSLDKTSDVWSGTVAESPSQLYATSLAEHTTVAYGCRMYMTAGVTYYFKGRYDDWVAVKVNGSWVMGNSSECQEASGSYTAATTGYYPVEFRVGNNGGPGGCTDSSYYGIQWRTSVNTTWRRVGNTAAETVFFSGR